MTLAIDRTALSKLSLVAVTYSSVERDCFATEEAYESELEVQERAEQVVAALQELGIPARAYAGDQHFMTHLVQDRPDVVVNLVDTLRGKDALQASVPAALELANVPYTGASIAGLVIGNDRNLVKQILVAHQIPTPPWQVMRRRGMAVDPKLRLPLIVKLLESGGSVGIDNAAVKETREAAQGRAEALIGEYKMAVIIEEYIEGLEVTAVVFEDSRKRHVFLGQKVFGYLPDGKHAYTSRESYHHPESYHYRFIEDGELSRRITRHAERAFGALRNRDYAKFDVRVDARGTPYFIDANPNTAFGPDPGLPFTEVLALHGIPFSTALASLMSKYARRIR